MAVTIFVPASRRAVLLSYGAQLRRRDLTVSDGFPAASCAAPRPRFRAAKRTFICLLLVAVFGAAIWFARVPLLQGAAELWIVSDPVTPADAVVVLGGELEVRPFAAADMYRKGLVNKVLVSQVAEDRAVQIGAVVGHTETNRQVLLRLGVPADAIETFGTANKNTDDEALALRDWAERHGVSTLIIPTEIFPARRVRFIFNREFPGKRIKIEVPSFDTPRYTREDWWKSDYGIIAFQNEILKYIYYRIKY
jgi:uncharacterized SAM-binding protein YcdF (DUF218 family)